MKLMPRATIIGLLICTAVAAAVALPVAAQTSGTGEPARRDSTAELGAIVFNEIELTPEGVTAYDTSGHRWSYDANDKVFALDPGFDPDRRGGGATEVPRETIEPVQKRCTEPLEISGLAAKAVFVGYDEYVDGDIKAYERVTVKGWVKGSIQSITGRVLVTASGRVDGDIHAPEIEVKPGGEVGGGQYITQSLNIPVDVIASSFSADGIWIVLGIALFLLLVAFLSVSLASSQLANVDACICEYRLRSLLVGLLSLCLLTPALVLLVVTVVGVLTLPIIFLVIVPIALIAGMAASVRQILQSVVRGRGEPPAYMFLALVGVLVYALFWMLVAILLGSSGSLERGLGYFVLAVTILLTTYPLLTGLGAVVLTRFGFRRYARTGRDLPPDGVAAPMPAPPPMPGGMPVPPGPDSGRGTPLKRPPLPGDSSGSAM